MSSTVSIILVDYKTSALAHKRARTLSTKTGYEVIVVDNNKKNRGYGAGINHGVAKSTGEYLLFLNPDVEITPESVGGLVSFLKENEGVSAVGPQFVDTKGNIVPSCLGKLSPLGAAVGLSFLQSVWKQNPWSSPFWLPDWKRDTVKDVATINGACMLVRRQDFAAVGGFDESFFLYWEENDLCDRLQLLGKRIVFLPSVRVIHEREVSMRQSRQDLSSIFANSRRFYLQKRFGLMIGGLIDIWLWIADEWRLILLFCLSLFFRLKDLGSISIIDDVRRDYGQALLMLAGKGIPLLGIPSSVPRFSQGPLNVWFDALAFKLGGASLYPPVFLASVGTSLGVVVLYLLLKKHVGKNISLLASLLFALSPAAIAQSRMPFYLFAIPIFTLFFLQAIEDLGKRNARSVFLVVLTFCLLFQWELATIPFLGLLMIALYRNRIQISMYWKQIVLGFLIGLLPQILFDLSHRCSQLCTFVVWMGYRTVVVSGVDGRHGFVLFSGGFWLKVWKQFGYLFGSGLLFAVILVSIVLALIIDGKKLIRQTLYFYSLVGVGFLLIGLVVHGDPSEAYFPPFIVLISILVAFSVKALAERNRHS